MAAGGLGSTRSTGAPHAATTTGKTLAINEWRGGRPYGRTHERRWTGTLHQPLPRGSRGESRRALLGVRDRRRGLLTSGSFSSEPFPAEASGVRGFVPGYSGGSVSVFHRTSRLRRQGAFVADRLLGRKSHARFDARWFIAVEKTDSRVLGVTGGVLREPCGARRWLRQSRCRCCTR